MPGRRLTLALLVVSVWMTPLAATAAAGSVELSAWAQAITWIFEQQRAFHRELIAAVQALKSGGGVAAGFTLIAASFLYGVFHAAGPGHGKAVITAYLATQRENRVRAIVLSGLASLCQGLTALIIVYGVIYAAGLLPRDANDAVSWSERASFVLVAMMGGFLIWRAVVSWRRSGSGGHHAHCCHSHGPAPEDISRATDLRTALGIILSIGLRPCSGAVIVLVFAQASGLALAGILAVFAMSIGTGLAVSGLAIFVVSARSWIAGLSDGGGAHWRYAGYLVSITGGVILVAIGLSLLSASLQPRHPMGL